MVCVRAVKANGVAKTATITLSNSNETRTLTLRTMIMRVFGAWRQRRTPDREEWRPPHTLASYLSALRYWKDVGCCGLNPQQVRFLSQRSGVAHKAGEGWLEGDGS